MRLRFQSQGALARVKPHWVVCLEGFCCGAKHLRVVKSFGWGNKDLRQQQIRQADLYKKWYCAKSE